MKTKLILLILVVSSCKGTKISSLKECKQPELEEIEAANQIDFIETFSLRKISTEHVCFKLISNVNVVDVANGTIVPNQYVLLADDTIAEITDGKRLKLKIPKSTCILKIDGTGKYLAPGLCDMHSHYCGEMRFDYLLNGITTVRICGSENPHFTEQALVNGQQLIGPEVFCTTPLITRLNQLDTLLLQLDSTDAVYDWLYLNAYYLGNSMEETVARAKQHNLKVSLDFRQSLPDFSFPDGTVFEQLAGYDIIKDQPNISSYRFISSFATDQSKASNPTENSPWYGYVRPQYETSSFLNYLKLHPSQFCIGTEAISHDDFPVRFPGKSYKDEVNWLSYHSISNADIIRMATIHAYTMIKAARPDSVSYVKPFGEIKKGYRANLVLLDANPLEKIENYFKISALFIHGHYLNSYDRALLKKNARKFNLGHG